MYKRILLKLSGEALGNEKSSYDKEVLSDLLKQIKSLKLKHKLEIAIVLGGGNIFRGQLSSMLGFGDETAPADYIGMQATILNAFALKALLEKNEIEVEIQNVLNYEFINSTFNIKKAKKALSNNKVVIFSGGTGKPYLSTDTAAAKKAIEIEADAIFFAKNGVDGIYDSDPKKNSNAKFFPKITFNNIIENKLEIMDMEAIELLKTKSTDVVVFNMNIKNNIVNVIENPKTPKTIITK